MALLPARVPTHRTRNLGVLRCAGDLPRRADHPVRRVLVRPPGRRADRGPPAGLLPDDRTVRGRVPRRRGRRGRPACGTWPRGPSQIDAADLDEQERTTRAVIVSQATTTADLLEARLAEVSADPIFGLQDALPLILGMLTLPDAEVADAMPDVLAGAGQWFADVGAAAPRGRRPRLGAGRVRRLRDHRADRRPPWLARSTSDPFVTALRPPEGIDVDAWRGRLATAVETRLRPGLADVPRRAARRGPAAARGPTTAPVSRTSTAATTPTPGPCGTSRPPTSPPSRSTTSGWRRSSPSPRSTARSAPRRSARPTCGRSSTGCATTPRCTSPAATSWSAASRDGDGARLGGDDGLVRGAAAGALRRRGHDDRRQGLLLPAGVRRQPRRHLLRQRDRPDGVGHLRAGGDGVPRGDPRAPPPDRHGRRADPIPEFRKHMHNSAYAEGWGLYTERLSDEMGLYSGAVERLGMLSADSMRAGRLVVDTGLHALGWSREQAVQFMLDNSPLSAGVVRPEVDRYVVSPGTGDVLHDRPSRDPTAAPGGGAASGRHVRRPAVPLGGPRLGVAPARRARAGGASHGCPDGVLTRRTVAG